MRLKTFAYWIGVLSFANSFLKIGETMNIAMRWRSFDKRSSRSIFLRVPNLNPVLL